MRIGGRTTASRDSRGGFVTADQLHRGGTVVADSAEPSARVDACVILAGGLRALPIVRETQRSALDLWVGSRGTLFDQWLRRLSAICAPGASIRVIHDKSTPAPEPPEGAHGLGVSVATDRGEYRGPAGVVKDVTTDLPEDATILIADAARWCAPDLTQLVATHARTGGAVTVGANPDDSPAGVYLARRASLDLTPAKGFFDLKEQWLGKLKASGERIGVHRFSDVGLTATPTREAVIALARDLAGMTRAQLCEDGWPRATVPPSGVFRTIAADAEVAADAILVDAVVMPRAVVGAGAVVVRSLVCSGATVGASARLVDTVAPARAVRVEG